LTAITTDAEDASTYSFSNTARDGEQLDLLGEILDGHSIDVLTRAGIAAGWRCLDVGPGGGSLTTWMAEQVGPTGHVTALDLETHLLTPRENLTIVKGDVRTTALPDGLDLGHFRQVNVHLAERIDVLDKTVAALKPGGLLVTTDWDATAPRRTLVWVRGGNAAQAFHAFQATFLSILEDNGADLGWAHRAPIAFTEAGLVDVEATVHSRLWAGGTAGCLLHVSNSLQLEDQLIARGMTLEQLEVFRAAMRDPQTLIYGYETVTTTGRRPLQHT